MKSEVKAMNLYKWITGIILIMISVAPAQTGRITGRVYDKDTGNPLTGANIAIEGTLLGTASNSHGTFVLDQVPPGKVELDISYLGYKSDIRFLNMHPDSSVNIVVSLRPLTLSAGNVVVTSTKYARQVKDVALPLEVLSSSRIREVNPITLPDVLQNEPSVSLMRDGVWATDVSIRGMNRQNIVTLVNGNRIETSTNLAAGLSLVDVNDIDRVEVIKGAASSLYGSGAMGGVVNIITRGGSYNDGFRVSGSMQGGYQSVNDAGSGHFSINAGSGRWFGYLNGTMRQAGNTRTPEGVLPNSQFRDHQIAGGLGLKPTDNDELLIDYQDMRATDVGIPGGSPFPVTATATYRVAERRMFSTEYKRTNLFRALPAVKARYFRQVISRDVELVPNPMAVVRPNADHTTNGFQLQTNWIPLQGHFLVAGIDAWQRNYDGLRTKEIKPQKMIVADYPVPPSSYRSIGIFGQDEISLSNEKIKITAGGRFDRIRISNEEASNPVYIIRNGIRNDSPPADPLSSYPAGVANNNSWSGNLGLLLSVAKDIDVSLNAARAFRSPSLEERFQYIELLGNTYLGNPNLKPEKGYFGDAGIRVWENNTTLRGSIFLNEIRDMVIDRAENDSVFVKQNVGSARLYGFDLYCEQNILDNLVIYGNAAYVRGEDKGEHQNLPQISPLNGQLGFRTPLTPYFRLDASAVMFADQNNTAPGERSTSGYTYFNLSLRTIPIRLLNADSRFFFGVENITNKAYRNHLATNRGIIKLEPGRNFTLRWAIDLD